MVFRVSFPPPRPRMGMRALLALIFTFWVCAPAFAETAIRDVRLGKNGDRTRIVFDLSASASPKVFLLADPSRVVVDFENADAKGFDQLKSKGLVTGLRFGHFNAKTYRFVLDLSGPAKIGRAFALDPAGGAGHRYVIDIDQATRAEFADAVRASRTTTRPAAQAAPTPRRIAPKRSHAKRMVVLDPGHGGVDPGTLGVLGVNEKIITLKVARAIRTELENSGRYRVRLTRDRDIYIPHRQRYGIAHDEGADLFISIHADSIANPKVRGGTIYTLSETASDREAARLATKENKSDIIAGLDLGTTDTVVSGILIDLAQRETLNASVEFAKTLLPRMRQQVRMHKRGHRFANLLVLKSIDVPSILLETGYLTNRDDARMLNSRSGQRKIARAVLAAVDDYFASQTVEAR